MKPGKSGPAASALAAGLEALITVRDLLRHAVTRFNRAGLSFGHGSDNAWDEAVYLMLHHLSLPLDRLDPFLDARLTESERGAWLELVHRRVDQRIPAAYLTGEAWLGEYRFMVDPRVIVPRSFIAELLVEGLSPWIASVDAVATVLDLCTGSGCLAIIAADIFYEARVDAVDLSSDALAVARINCDDHGLSDRIELIESDLFEGVAGRRYDLVVSNPPYVNQGSMESLPPEYRHEPRMALAGGDDGLDLVRRILADAPRMLTSHGLLVVEVGHERPQVEAAFPRLPLTWLSTSGGDDAVFAISAAELTAATTRAGKKR